jgi:hypothetical protein
MVTIDLNGPSDEPMRVDALPGTARSKDAVLKIKEISINADIARIFDAKNKIDISKLSSVTDFHNAGTIADNYARMFSLGYKVYDY